MKKIYTLSILLFAVAMSFAQVRYLDAQFEVEVEESVVYANNIEIITGAPLPKDLIMDIYSPKDDTETERPLILVSHTGSFLPPIINGQATGSVKDGTVIYLCNQLAARGYVVAAFTNRLGWLPTSTDQNVRTGSLLQAAYRGIQDGRSCVRFFRKDAAENGNAYGINPDKIGMVGIGTGGYISYGCGSIYDFDDVTLPKFIDTNTALPYIDSTLYGNIYGDTQAGICLPNHPGYSSEIDFAFNIGGALGDRSWINGSEEEAMFAGVHSTNDVFAPFSDGPVIVPTTNEFVVNVAGTNAAISTANAAGNNDAFSKIINDPLADLIEAQKATDVTLWTMQTVPLGTDNFYAFVTPFPQGSPWDFWDKDILDLQVAGTNAVLGTTYDADTIHLNGLATNPDMSPAKGMTYLDSTLMLMLPRSCVALGLNCEGVTGVEDQLTQHMIEVAPNPAVDRIRFRSGDQMIQSIQVVDISGKLMFSQKNINQTDFTLDKSAIGSGVFLAQLRFEDGNQTVKFIFE